MSVIRLRFNARRFARQAAVQDHATTARRAAYRDELMARGHEPP
jgi:hypothetical protein